MAAAAAAATLNDRCPIPVYMDYGKWMHRPYAGQWVHIYGTMHPGFIYVFLEQLQETRGMFGWGC
jgi:hypothetical protein